MGARLRTALVGACLVALLVAAPTAQAAFPGANGKIAFVQYASGAGGQIYTMDADGTGRMPLTSGPANNFEPSWSPDGKKIAFASARDDPNPASCFGYECNTEIYVMDANGGNQTRLTNEPALDGSPQWSPDGTKIVFDSNRTGDFDIYSMNADGTGVVRLTSNQGRNEDPAWSPDGTKIAFSSGFYDASSGYDVQEIVLMNPDGTNHSTVTSDPSFYETKPDWSPDATTIAYQQDYCCDDTENELDAATIRRDGTGYVGLSRAATAPAWSPDGSRIAVGSQDCRYFGSIYFCSSKDIITMNPDGSGRTNITNNGSGGSSSEPSWQPISNRPPNCSGVGASRSVLSTANHRLIPITLDGATDPDGDPITLSVEGVTQDEPVVGSGDNTSPDAVDQGRGQLRVRAERNPHGDGRVYRIAFTVADDRGGSCSGTAKVAVPRKTRKPAVDSAPPSYDSLVR